MPAPKKIKYLYDDRYNFEEKGKRTRRHYIRSWKQGKGRSAWIIVQVWLDVSPTEAITREPDGDFKVATPVALTLAVAVARVVMETRKRG